MQPLVLNRDKIPMLLRGSFHVDWTYQTTPCFVSITTFTHPATPRHSLYVLPNKLIGWHNTKAPTIYTGNLPHNLQSCQVWEYPHDPLIEIVAGHTRAKCIINNIVLIVICIPNKSLGLPTKTNLRNTLLCRHLSALCLATAERSYWRSFCQPDCKVALAPRILWSVS